MVFLIKKSVTRKRKLAATVWRLKLFELFALASDVDTNFFLAFLFIENKSIYGHVIIFTCSFYFKVC